MRKLTYAQWLKVLSNRTITRIANGKKRKPK